MVPVLVSVQVELPKPQDLREQISIYLYLKSFASMEHLNCTQG